MRISLSGISGSGKSTLAKKLSESISVLKYIPACTRNVRDEFGEMDYKDPIMILDLQQKLITSFKLDLESAGDSYITDRSFMDVLAYAKLLLGYAKIDTKEVADEVYTKFNELVVRAYQCQAEYFDLLYYVEPFEVVPSQESDKYREGLFSNPIFNEMWSELIFKFHKNIPQDTLIINSLDGDVERRFQLMNTIINDLLILPDLMRHEVCNKLMDLYIKQKMNLLEVTDILNDGK